MRHRPAVVLLIVLSLFATVPRAGAQAAGPFGIVVMHGKGGSPDRHVNDLANGLERKGYLVANLEMPWSGRRSYDTDVAGAEREVTSALNELKKAGATRLFVAGHSLGGLFALHYGSRFSVDGIIAIAPGGNVASQVFRERLGPSLAEARQRIAAGKGTEPDQFMDLEGSRGGYGIETTAVRYLSWFDPEGAMNQVKALKSLPPSLPVLFIVPTNDYPGLQRIKTRMFGLLPANGITKLYEPDASHLGAPSESRDEIVRWTAEVAARK